MLTSARSTLCIFSLACATFLTGLTQVEAAPDDIVEFTSPDLAFGVLLHLHSGAIQFPPQDPGEITEAHMEQLTRFAPHEFTTAVFEIGDFNGLQFATNLESIDLLFSVFGAGQLDLTPLGGLTSLRELCLGGFPLTGLDAIQGMTSLQRLCLPGCDLTETPAISNLTNLTTLELRGNQLTDLSSLQFHSGLRILDLDSNTALSDLLPIANLNSLEFLSLRGTSVTDLRPLAGLTHLESLQMSATGVSDLTPITGLTQLESLQLDGTPLSDLAPVSGLAQLTFLSIDETTVTDLSPLSGLTNLRAIHAEKNPQLADLTGIEGILGLQVLRVDDCQVSDLTPLGGLPNLQFLDLNNNLVSDLTPISQSIAMREIQADENLLETLPDMAQMTSLSRMWVRKNSLDRSPDSPEAIVIAALRERGVYVGDSNQIDPYGLVLDAVLENAIRDALGKPIGWISPQDMAGLMTLTVEQAEIVSLTGIEHAVNLQHLDLSENSVADLSPLAGLTALTHLDLASNRIVDLSPLAGLAALTELDLAANGITDIAPLAGLTGLDYIDLDQNGLDDTPGTTTGDIVANLEAGGTSIDINGQVWPVINFGSLAVRTAVVETLGIEEQLLISPTDLMPLRRLVIANLGITDLGGLESAVNLEALQASRNNISDLGPVGGLVQLEFLDVSGNPAVSDLAPVASLTELQYLDLTGLPAGDLSPLAGLVNLEHLLLGEVDTPAAQAIVSALEGAETVVYLANTSVRTEPGDLAFTKVLYRPLPPDAAEIAEGFEQRSDFEYIILKNLTGETLDVSLVEFEDGVDFDFREGIYHSIPPGFEIAVAGNFGAFEMRYGSDSRYRIAGEFEGKLADSGEEVRIDSQISGIIRRMSYNVYLEAWPTEASEIGVPLILLSQDRARSHDMEPQFWRVPEMPLAPFESDVYTYAMWKEDNFDPADLDDESIVGPYADPDRDGTENVAEYAFGSGPLDPQDGERERVFHGIRFEPPNRRYLEMSHFRHKTADEAIIIAQSSIDLTSWRDTPVLFELFAIPVPATEHEDGSGYWCYRTSRFIGGGRTEYIRLTVRLVE